MSVLVIGSLDMDLVASMEKFPESGETIEAEGFASIPGGKGLNQALAAARLGAHVKMFGAIGSDENSRVLEKILTNANIEIENVQRYEGSSGVAIVEVENSSSAWKGG
ncbi:MAG: hypothetical protein EXQ65_04165 [Candidatus Planktophila sp.]|nr:hypothetical protein [Candidatus Planktophila sp.]MSO25146.1 hypothetical protein [Candidatus Planktophila sp.]